MKKKFFAICTLSLITASVLVTSCNNIINYIVDPTKTSTNVYDKNLDLTNNTNPYSQGKDYFYNVINSYSQATPSTGNIKLLVVPVAFKDKSYTNKYGNDETIKSNLEDVFFSDSNSYWESVASFYTKSSYGQLNFSGEVTDVYTTKYSLDSYLRYSDAGDATNNICDEIYSTLDSATIDEYDTNGDGVIDCMWFVYLYPYNSSKDFLWAYTYWNTLSTSAAIGNYSWASYEFIIRSTLSKTYYDDAHTFIHETGHQLGLEDYYSYDDYQTNRSPVGGLDMMDCNILDHSAMTKYNLGWANPTVINSEGTYTLKPFESSGDCLILASNFSGTCFDEYFIIEYYTPTGLNELDSTTRYKSSAYPLGFTESGLKISHVDQRLGKINIDISTSNYTYTWDNKYYSVVTPNVPTTVKPYYYTYVNSNTESRCRATSRWALVELVQASGSTNLMTHYTKGSYANYAKNSDLFTISSNIFGQDIYSSYISNEGWKLPYKVEITSQDSSQIVLKVSKI
jgi:M6 family metalloprotease-like protein